MRALALVLLCSSVLADKAEWYARHLAGQIRTNWSTFANVDYILDDEAYDVFSRAPKYAAEISATAAKHVRTDSIREEPWDKLAVFLMRVTERCLALSPKDPDAIRAAADAHLTRARVAARLERKPRVRDWLNAIDLLVRLHRFRPDDGKTLAEAARILLDEYRDKEKLAAVCEVGRGAYPKIGLFRVPKMRARLDAAVDDIALKKLLGDWKPLGKTYDDDLLALYNEAVTVAKRRNVKTKHEWLVRTARRATRGVMFDVPWYRWVGHDTLQQYDRDGTLRAEIRFERESGALTKRAVALSAELLKNRIGGKFTLKPKKRTLNKHFRTCYSYAMGGLDKKGDFVHVRCYFVRTGGSRGSTATRIEIRTRTAKSDPEIKLILATLRPYSLEPGK